MHQPTLRVLEIIKYISKAKQGARLADLSRELNIPKSTILPILQTLCEQRYLHNDNGVYGVGTTLFSLGADFAGRFPTLRLVREKLTELVEIFGETCFFGVLEDGNVLYVDKVDSPNPLRMLISTGKKLPAYATGIGKALLMGKSEDELKNLYHGGLIALTENTMTDVGELAKQLSIAEKEGFAQEIEESAEHIRCFAVPIKKHGKTVAAISVAIPVFRFVNGNEKSYAATLKTAAEYISRTIEETDAHFGGIF